MNQIPVYSRHGILAGFTTVDADDYSRAIHYRWDITNGYARHRHMENARMQYLQMHRFILGITDPEQLVDHIDGDRLNNRRGNLRIATASQNAQNRGASVNNSSGYKGVLRRRYGGLYDARIMVRGVRHELGPFTTAIEAHQAYEAAAARLHGEFANSGNGCLILEAKP